MGKDRTDNTPETISFRVAPENLGEEIAERTKEGESPNVNAREALKRYYTILRREMPKLSKNEWMVIYAI